jgi:hypothetical protein
LDAKCRHQPVVLGVKAVVGGRVYDYEVRFTRGAFVAEHLKCWEGPDEETALFERHRQNVQGEWSSDERFKLLSQDFRANALLLSLADRLTPALARNVAVSLRRLLTQFSEGAADPWDFAGAHQTARRAHRNREFREWLLMRLKSADIGVVDLSTEQRSIPSARTMSLFDETEIASPEAPDSGTERSIYLLSLVHRGAKEVVEIPYRRESHGTRRLVEIAPMLFDLIHDTIPQTLFIDEIDESLHPLLLQGIIRHLNCEIPVKSVRGQLIFATHDTTLMDDPARDAVLRRDQIYLTEKDASGAARLYSVAEFKERNNLNLRRRYLQGRYGALPVLGAFAE